MFNTIAVIAGILITVLFIETTLPSFVQSEWQVYHLNATLSEGTLKNQEFKIPYKVTNGSIGEMKSDVPTLKISIVNASNNGILAINLPTDFVEYYDRIGGGGVAVLVNGKEIEYPLDFNSPSCFRTILVKFDSNSKNMTIHGYDFTSLQLKLNMPPLYLFVNKNNNDPQIVTISGCTDLKLDDKEVTLQISDSQGKTHKTISAIPDINGTFSTSVPTEQLHGDGTYIINATFAGHSIAQTFTLPKFQQTNNSLLLPLNQFKSGTSAKDVKCNQDLVLVIKKSDNSPACVKPQTAQKLVERGWGVLNEQTVWFEFDQIECQTIPWNKLFENVTIATTEKGKVLTYFAQQGITILDAKLISPLANETPVPLCGGMSGISFYFLVPESDVDKMMKLGYKTLTTLPSSPLLQTLK